MTATLPNVWFTESAQSQAVMPASTATDAAQPPASVAPISVSDGVPATSPPSTEMVPAVTLATAPSETAAATVSRPDTNAAADISSDTKHIVEYFSDYARDRCMDKISPPRDIDRIALGIVSAALDLHPRNLDDDPAPLFIRKPRPEFLRALFDLGGVR